MIAPLASISKVDESTSIGVSAATPISIPCAPSIVTLPLFEASMSTPVCPSNVKLPASEFISIPPTEVLIFVAPSTSIDKVEVPSIVIAPLASISKVEESMSIGLSVVVPMFIPVSESILKAPDDEIAVVDSPLIVIAPLESISNVDDSTLNGLSIAVPI